MKKQAILIFLFASILSACGGKSETTSESQANTTSVETPECFVYQANKDSAFLHVSIADSIVTGELSYLLFEKDKNVGKIVGQMSGDTLFATYTFSSEGTESKREIALLKDGTGWTEGFGPVEERGGSMVFQKHSELKFTNGLHFKAVDCPED